jgi:YcaO-like protein with predicted kinase domain
MFKNLNRPYKECSAKDTIENIQNILKKLDLMPQETFTGNPYPQIYSVRIELSEDKGKFGTNGKGRNHEYSLASAYAEFLERMQNGLYAIFSRTIISQIKNEFGFYYSPEERYLNEEEFSKLDEEILGDMIRYTGRSKGNFIVSYFERLKLNRIPGVVAVPFFDIRNDKELYLPVNLLSLAVGSNGMAAGNTRAEAIFQALCELMERWGAAEIFYDQLTPPIVPTDFLQQFKEEYRIIENIEKKGDYKVTVKDFSAGRGVPSLGMIIENVRSRKYKLNVGCDTSFQVALSRCLTEIYQGTEDQENFDKKLLEIPTEQAEYFKKNDEEALYERYTVFGDFTKDGSGVFPKSLFSSKPDYGFDPGTFTTRGSYQQEINAIIENFHKNGHDVYVRDVSFMGFPSVFIYIPGISALGRKNAPIFSVKGTFNIVELDKIEPMIFDFQNRAAKEYLQIAKTLEKFDGAAVFTELFNVKLKDDSPWNQVNLAFILTLIWYRLGKIKKSHDCFKQFLKNRKQENEYYKIVEKYLELKSDGYPRGNIIQKIKEDLNLEREDLIQEVINDLADPKDVFKFTKFPKCPDCPDCPLNTDCLTKNQVEISRRLYPLMTKNKINQKSLDKIITV